VPELNLHVVTRYDLLREALRDTQTYSSRFDAFLAAAQQLASAAAPDAVKAELARIHDAMIPLPPTLLTLDEPEHGQYRALVGKLFTASQTRKFEDSVVQTIERTIDRFIEGPDTIEFMRAFAFPVPLEIIADRLGIPPEDRPFFNEAATAAAAALRLRQTPDNAPARLALGIWQP
jgi:cytochrome P450